MSTAPLMQTGGRRPGRVAPTRASPSVARSSAPGLTLIALLAVILYAAFAHGGVSPSAATRIEVALAALAALAGAALVWTGTLRLRVAPPALAGGALLALFAAWSAVTVLWSVAPNQTWLEVNRELAYLVALALAAAVGASHRRAIQWAAHGYLALALVVAAYALGQKVLPGLRVPGLFDLNQTGPLPRLQEPLGYWNALALFLALAVPVALAVAVDGARTDRARLAMAAVVAAMLVIIVFTYSRGGLLALAAALLVGLWLSGERLRWLLWLAVAVLAAAPAAAYGLSVHALTHVGVSLASRQAAGVLLLFILAAGIAALIAARSPLLALEGRLSLAPARAAVLRRRGLALGAAAAACLLVALALSGVLADAWRGFTTTRAASNSNPSHLLSADSQNRWVWWKEAARAFAARPAGGWGAGSFGVVHLLYRRDTLSVQQPHSVPLQFLCETGIVGAALAIAAYLLLAGAVWRAAATEREPRQRLLAAALAAGVVGYGVHSLYDWDWEIPAITLPVMLFAGVLAGHARLSGRPGAGRPAQPNPSPARGRAPGARAAALVLATLWACAFGVSDRKS